MTLWKSPPISTGICSDIVLAPRRYGHQGLHACPMQCLGGLSSSERLAGLSGLAAVGLYRLLVLLQYASGLPTQAMSACPALEKDGSDTIPKLHSVGQIRFGLLRKKGFLGNARQGLLPFPVLAPPRILELLELLCEPVVGREPIQKCLAWGLAFRFRCPDYEREGDQSAGRLMSRRCPG